MKKIGILFIVMIGVILVGCTPSEPPETTPEEQEYIEENVNMEILSEELESPWGLDFYNSDYIFITERVGNIVLFDLSSYEKTEIGNVPEVVDQGQGGMLDVEYDEPYLYVTYVASNDEGTATHLGRGEFNYDEMRLDNFEELYVVEPYKEGSSHFGSRVITTQDYVYMSTGDRGDKDFDESHISQDTQNSAGAIVRLNKDGSVPETNPFIDDDDKKSSIYTFGHRNVQGMTIHPERETIWISEHGERDGDTISELVTGANYGWPLAHYGCEYGTTIPVGDQPDELDWVEEPEYYWECQSGGFPPAGMDFYEGDEFEEWQGDLFLGNLAGQYLGRFSMEDGELEERAPLLDDRGWRIRDVRESSYGELYVLVDSGEVVRLSSS